MWGGGHPSEPSEYRPWQSGSGLCGGDPRMASGPQVLHTFAPGKEAKHSPLPAAMLQVSYSGQSTGV